MPRKMQGDTTGLAERPLKPFRVMLDQETQQASTELERPMGGVAISSMNAGIGVGISAVLIGAVYLAMPGEDGLRRTLLTAGLYAVGFIVVILGRMDLFTEYTTIAILPVLARRSRILRLLRFWLIVYAGNLFGGLLLAMFAVAAGPSLHLASADAYAVLAHDLTRYSWWVMLLSATLAGWLMGALSWLIIGGRDTISQVFFIGIIAFAIGFAHLHHVIVGGIQMFSAAILTSEIGGVEVLRFLFWVTLGNIQGGAIFAASIHSSVGLQSRNGRQEA